MRTLISRALRGKAHTGQSAGCPLEFTEGRQAHGQAQSPMTNTVPRDSEHSALLPVSGRIWKMFVTAANPPVISSISPTGLLRTHSWSELYPCPCPCRPCFQPQPHLPLAWPSAHSGLVFDFKLVDCSAKGRKMWKRQSLSMWSGESEALCFWKDPLFTGWRGHLISPHTKTAECQGGHALGHP